MKHATVIAAFAGGAIVVTAVGIASYAVIEDADEESLAAAEENCRVVEVEQQTEPRDDKRVAGTAIGALIGGAVGNDVGDSDVTTAAGAAAGAYAARKAQEEFQEGRTESVEQVRCEPDDQR